MKTSSRSMGVRVCGCVGDEATSHAPMPPHTLPGAFHGRLILPERVLSCILLTAFLLTTSGCAYYSLTAATIPQRFETIAIPLAENATTSPFADLGSELTDQLVNRFVRQTRLRLQNDENASDVVLTTRLVGYRNQPTAVGEEQATLNRVTVQVDVLYYDNQEEEALLDRTFSSSEEYDPIADGSAGEQAAAFAALQNVADDVFSAATSDW